MTSFRYKEYSDAKFEIVGKNEELKATVEQGADHLWRIILAPNWTLHGAYNLGPFSSAEEALLELGADQADQS